MSGFDNLEGAVDASQALQPIKADQTAFQSDELPSDEVAVALVKQDVTTCLNFLQSKQLVPVMLDTCDDLIRAYIKPRFWSDGQPKANMPFYTVMEATEKILSIMYMSLFGTGKRRPFEIDPIGKTTADAARAKASVLHWCTKKSGFKDEMRLALKSGLSYGWCVVQDGWETVSHRRRETKMVEGKAKRDWKEVLINQPTVENLDLRKFGFDTHCTKQNVANNARFKFKQEMITANDLDDMRQDIDTYGVDGEDGKRVSLIPSREELKNILAAKDEPTEDSLNSSKRTVWHQNQSELDVNETTIDPLNQPLEYVEYWTDSWVIGVLQGKIPIRKQVLGAEFTGAPFRSWAFIDVINSAWGFGVARLLAGDQKFQTGVGNNAINSLALVLNPAFQLIKGIGPGTQNINLSPGKILQLGGELKPLTVPNVFEAAMQAMEASNEWASRRVGANGGSNVPTQALRTTGGMNAFNGDIIQRLQYYLEQFIYHVYLPTLESMLRIAMEKLEPEQIQFILNEEQGKQWEGDLSDVYNADIAIDVIAGADMLAKQAAAQLIPVMTQLVASQPVQDSFTAQGKKFNYTEFVSEGLELMGWDIDVLIEPATQDDIARAMMMKTAVANGAADQKLQQQKHGDAMDEIDEKGFVQAGVGIVKQAAKTHMDAAMQTLQGMQEAEQPEQQQPEGVNA